MCCPRWEFQGADVGNLTENESGNDVAASRNAVQNNSEISSLITANEATDVSSISFNVEECERKEY